MKLLKTGGVWNHLTSRKSPTVSSNHTRGDYPSEPIISLANGLSPWKVVNGLNVRADDLRWRWFDGQVAGSGF